MLAVISFHVSCHNEQRLERKEDAMAKNIAVDCRRYLIGIEYPAGLGEILAAAARGGAPRNMCKQLERLPRVRYGKVDDVERELEELQTTGKRGK